MINKIIIIIVIIIILGGGSFFLFRSGFGKKEVLSTPDILVGNTELEVLSPTSSPIPTPIPTKLDVKVDLNKELESVEPVVLDSDFSNLQSLISSF